MRDRFLLFFCLLLCLSLLAISHETMAVDYDYAALILQDLEEMEDMARAILGKKDADPTEQGMEALRLIFSRPDGENMRTKLLPLVRSNLSNPGEIEKLIVRLGIETLARAKGKQGTSNARNTDLVILDGVLSELQPTARKDPTQRKLIQQIREARIKLTPDMMKERRDRSLLKNISPSDRAATLLKDLDAQDKRDKKSGKKTEEAA